MNILPLVITLSAIVALLEYLTPPDYVFGYLYIGPILLSSHRLSRRTTLITTIAASGLTLLNIWFPSNDVVTIPTIASRLIAVLALIVTGILGDRNHLYQQALLQQEAKLKAQEQLAQVREDFASTLTHDLKTPLLGAIETLKAFQTGSFGGVQSTQQKVLSTIIRSQQNSLQMVETLLDVYRNDLEGLKLNRATVDLVAIAEEVTANLTELASSRRVSISLSFGESDFRRNLWVRGDALQLQRVFSNLITNGINHSPRGGKVQVILETHHSYQQVQVLDSGSGISAAETPLLFERFYRGQTERQAPGSGLGLYLTRQIVEAHGGQVWAANRASGGAIFGFHLPASVNLAAFQE